MMKTDRSFGMFLLLSIITFGIYSIIFFYNYVEDLNVVCSKDGKSSMNYIVVWLLSIVTGGIFMYVWYYMIGDRLEQNCRAYGIPSSSSGTNLLLWSLLGSLIIVGPFIAQYKMIEDLNNLSIAYNNGVTL